MGDQKHEANCESGVVRMQKQCRINEQGRISKNPFKDYI